MNTHEEEELYKVNVTCNNCLFEEMLEIPVGIKVSELDCPYCGCDDCLELDKDRLFCGDIEPSDEVNIADGTGDSATGWSVK